MTVGDGGTLTFGELFVESPLVCETARVLWLSKSKAEEFEEGVDYIGAIVGG